MATPSHLEFLYIDHPTYDESEQSPIQPHLDTLFTEFSRFRRRMSRSRSPAALSLQDVAQAVEQIDEPPVDLRALDYVSEYDSHLMCPICHVPFIDPIVIDCDHTFCSACFEEYRAAADHSQRSQCPTCRAYLLSRPRKASRLIINMCNDIRARCPNEECEEIHPRGCITQHATRDCPETRLPCPDAECGKIVKRKNFVPFQCIHSSHIECDCGAVIELGRGEWLKHKDEDCPTTGVKCDHCNERISVKDYLAGRNAHVCATDTMTTVCPGAEFGCTTDLTLNYSESLEEHKVSCPLARLAPHLQKQFELLSSLSDQLALTKVRNEVLETGLDKLSTLIHDRILPFLPPHPRTPSAHSHDLEIEEIPRNHPPTRSPPLSLPAHLRPLTPDFQPSSQDIQVLHSNLQDGITSLSTSLTSLQHAVAELDARTSMTMMNETLRLKEDLAHQSAGLFSTRAQVQWLLNRERERMMILRGRSAEHAATQSNATGMGMSARSSETDSGGTDLPVSGNGSGSDRTSPRVRPQMRRLSGSQERVKL